MSTGRHMVDQKDDFLTFLGAIETIPEGTLDFKTWEFYTSVQVLNGDQKIPGLCALWFQ